MSGLEGPRISDFSRLLLRISQEVTKEQFDQIQLVCCTESVFRPRALAYEMTSTAQVLTHLQKYNFLSIDNLAFLFHVLGEIGRVDLANTVKAFHRSRFEQPLPAYDKYSANEVSHPLSVHGQLHTPQLSTSATLIPAGMEPSGCGPEDISADYQPYRPVPGTAESAAGDLVGFDSGTAGDTQDVEMMDTDETEYKRLANELSLGIQPRWQQPQDAAYQPVGFGHYGCVHDFNVLQLESMREQLSRLVGAPTYQLPWLSKGISLSYWTMFLFPNQAVLRLKTLAEESDEGLLGLGLKWVYIPVTGEKIYLDKDRRPPCLVRNSATSMSISRRKKARYYKVSKKPGLCGKPQDVWRMRRWKRQRRTSEIDRSQSLVPSVAASGTTNGERKNGKEVSDKTMTIPLGGFYKFYEKLSKSRMKYNMDFGIVLSKGKALEEYLSSPRDSPVAVQSQTSKPNCGEKEESGTVFADRFDSGYTEEKEVYKAVERRRSFAKFSGKIEREKAEKSYDSAMGASEYSTTTEWHKSAKSFDSVFDSVLDAPDQAPDELDQVPDAPDQASDAPDQAPDEPDQAQDVDVFTRQTFILLGTYQSQFEKYIRKEMQLKQKLRVLIRENDNLRLKVKALDMESRTICEPPTADIKSPRRNCEIQ